MKKTLRIFTLLTAFVLLCLSATGCNAIDEMRARHAFYTDNGNGIMLGKTEYRLLPENEYFSPIRDNGDEIYVTDKDVPVLLSAILGVGFDSYNNGLILSTGIYGDDRNYCRADKYDEVAAQMAGEFSPTGYCYTYSAFDTETKMYEDRAYLLTEEQEKAVNDILATVEGVERAENANYYCDYSIILMACTDNMLLQDLRYSIEKNNNIYYLVAHDVVPNNEVEYTVPATYNTVFDAILKDKIDAEKAEQEYYKEHFGYNEEDFEYEVDYEDYDEDIMVI